MNKEKLINAYRGINKKEVVDEMVSNLLYFRNIEGMVYVELELETGDINVEFSSSSNPVPDFDKSICLSVYTTGNLEEALPSLSDLPDEIKNADDDVAEYFRIYGMDIFEFISEEEFKNQLEARL